MKIPMPMKYEINANGPVYISIIINYFIIQTGCTAQCDNIIFLHICNMGEFPTPMYIN